MCLIHSVKSKILSGAPKSTYSIPYIYQFDDGKAMHFDPKSDVFINHPGWEAGWPAGPARTWPAGSATSPHVQQILFLTV